MKLNLEDVKNLVILGGTRGIGLAFVNYFNKLYPQATIHLVHRKESDLSTLKDKNIKTYELDMFSDNDVKHFSESLIGIDIFINTVGVLHTKNIQPEKSLRDFDINQSLLSFKINSLLTPLWAKHLKNKFSKTSPSLFLSISAKVGSIEDNKIGGWHSYRASKSALNMMIKNISIEYERSRIPCQVVAAHPGTTVTDLSRPFISNTSYQLWQPEQTVENIFSALDNIDAQTGIFLDWKGGKLPW